MRRAVTTFILFIYLTLVPLCVSGIGHLSTQSTHHEGHAHSAHESVPLPLSYHAHVYQSLVGTLLTLTTILLGIVFLGAQTRIATLVPVVSIHLLRLRIEQPPDTLRQRLALLTHAPPRYV